MAVAALAVALALAAFWLLRDDYPSFEGKKLASWLSDYNPNAGDAKSDKAASVIENAGASALPELVHLLGANTSGINSLKTFVRRWMPFLSMRASPDLQWKAVLAFKLLGSRAGPAVSKLAGLLEQGRNPGYAASALGYIGPDALPHLMTAVTNREVMVRFAAINAIGRMGTNGLASATVLQQALQDPDPRVVGAAADALKELGIGRFGPINRKE